MEHCVNPFKMAENLVRLLKPGGTLCISVPFSWQIHGYPNDYWRFTYEGVKILFPTIEFDMDRSVASLSKDNDFQKINDDLGKIFFSFSRNWRNGHYWRAISAKLLKVLSKIGIFSFLAGYDHVFAPTGILLVGRLKN